MQIAKRILLFVALNILVMFTITLVFGVLSALGVFHGHSFGYMRYYGHSLDLGDLAIFCLVWGMGGAFISLWLSRIMAKWTMGVQVIDPKTSDAQMRQLVVNIHDLARRAGLATMPEVGIYDSPELNAFATGPTRNRALVAVSSGLLQTMPSNEFNAVVGHEITHIVNGDMVTMTLLQGVINAFVMFIARILAFVITQAMRSRDERDNGGGFFMQYMLVMLFQFVFSIFGFMVLMWFSRWREFRADAGGARLAGTANMIGALRDLERFHNPQVAAAEAQRSQAFQALKIDGGRNGFMRLFMSHPPIEERIARLEQTKI